jgi:tetratricopeptide (TPR) repeat protein
MTPATVFSAAVRAALEHYADPQWLGRRSPLASPYFLSGRHPGGAAVMGLRERGLLLQGVLGEAATSLWDGPLPQTRTDLIAAVDEDRARLGSKSPRYYYLVLELRYLRRHFPPSAFPTAVEAMPGYVNVSPTRFFIHLEEAIDELGRRMLERLVPALRLERPDLVAPPIGRSEVIDFALRELLAGRSVALTGAGGVGKSTVGAALLAVWPSRAVFWHTFRPGLNDDLSSLLFSLGHFAHGAGAPVLWAQLLAGEGRVGPPAQTLGFLRMDLEAIAARRPLLCFDEVDLLHTSTGDPRRKQHIQVLELLESLRGVVPLLLIGQRVYVDVDIHCSLEPLPPGETEKLLRRLGLEPDAPTLRRVHRFSGGNPRLLELYAALRRSGDEGDDVLALPREPSAQPLFSRLWRRLDDEERELLGGLSVFRSFAPSDAWTERGAALGSLIDRRLVKADAAGGVGLLPFIRDLVREALPPEQRRRLQGQAAFIRAQRGDYTAAAYHYWQADDSDAAVQVWFAHQDGEILAGQAGAADEVFRQIEPARLNDSRRGQLQVIRNRLALLAGEAERALEGMESFHWEVDDETTATAIGQWGYANELLGQSEQALNHFDQAIAMLSRVISEIATWHMRRGLLYTEQIDLQTARRETQLARADIERLQGVIDYMAGVFEPAQVHFKSSLQNAEAAADRDRIAKAHYMLAMLAGRQGRIDDARVHAETAMSHFAAIGDRLQLEGMRAELAGMYLNVRQFEAVIEPAERALAFFERIKHQRWISAICNNLAEAYLETGRLDQARQHALRVLQLEIPRSRPYALYTLGHIHDREGHTTYAEVSFGEGIAVAQTNDDRFIQAYLARALGALLAREGRPDGMANLEAALKLFSEMGLQHEVAETETAIRAARPEEK